MKHPRGLFFRYLCLLLFVGGALLSARAQEEVFPTDYFRNPLNLPVSTPGTFAEFRPNHYHSGLDLRTGGHVGEPVFAAAEGYVSRINISPWGGGKVLYIDHPNGYRTVYMHLDDFVGDIGTFIRNYQKEHECFAFDINVDPGHLPVKKGQLVAHSGNTGGSGGPHLHFEIRHSKDDETINPFYFGLKYADNVDPLIRGIRLYPEGKKPFKVASDTVDANGRFYVGVYATDQCEKGVGKNGVEKIEVFVDDTLFMLYHTRMFHFEETRSVNAIIDYSHYQATKETYVVSRTLPALRLGNHKVRNKGYLRFEEGSIHRISVKVSDYKGNAARTTFHVRQLPPAMPDEPMAAITPRGRAVYYAKSAHLAFAELEADLDEYTVYDNDLVLYNSRRDPRFLGACHTFVLKDNPLPPHKAYTLRLKRPSGADPSKMVIVSVSGTRYSACPTTRNGEWLESRVKTFGDFAVMADTEAPVVKPSNFNEKKAFSGAYLRLKATDNLSGLQEYKCYVDGRWVLAEYDGKTAALIISAKELRNGTNTLRVVAADAVGNRTEKTYTVRR